MMELRVLALYPDQMNIYADRGNILFLQRRCEWRGIGFSLRGRRARASGSTPAPTTSSTSAAARTATSGSSPRDMVATKRDALAAAVDDGAVVLAVCGGYQLLGHSYQLGERADRRASASSTSRPCASPARG